jgi:hypothetical protein
LSQTFEEGRLRFSFGESWRVVKYDDHRDYRQKIAKLEGSGALDFVACRNGLFLIEVKDFRGYRIENKERLEQGHLAEEVAGKVRDTIAGLVGAHQCSSEPEFWEPYASALVRRTRPIRVILWLEHDHPPGPVLARRWKSVRMILAQTLKTKLRWLTTKVAVVGHDEAQLQDLVVSSLPAR